MPLKGTDILARHALDKNHRRADNSVKAKAFQPAKDGAMSSFKITGLKDVRIKALGNKYVAAPRGKPLVGWSEIDVGSVQVHGLTLVHDNTPFRHVNIVDWPKDKGECLSIQQQLASKAKFKPV